MALVLPFTIKEAIPPDIRHNIGRFRISLELAENLPYATMEICSRIVIIRAEIIYPNTIDYVGMSPLFRKLKEGEQIPIYNGVIRQTEVDGVIAREIEFIEHKNDAVVPRPTRIIDLNPKIH